MSQQPFTLCTNACATDDVRIGPILRSWLRTFGDRISELLVVVDSTFPTGRIKNLHGGTGSLERVLDELQTIQHETKLLRVQHLPEFAELKPFLRKWFKSGLPNRCENGSPIAAFVYTFEQCRGNMLLRADCDMVFHDRGFAEEAWKRLHSGDLLVQPPKQGNPLPGHEGVSSRAFFISPAKFQAAVLPMKAYQIDLARRFLRWRRGFSGYRGLEGMIDRELTRKKLPHCTLSTELGYSCHLGERAFFLQENIERDIRDLENGIVPPAQVAAGWNYVAEAWQERMAPSSKSLSMSG